MNHVYCNVNRLRIAPHSSEPITHSLKEELPKTAMLCIVIACKFSVSPYYEFNVKGRV